MKRALIIKIGAIGDAIMALPLVTALKANGFGEVVWLGGGDIKPILEMIPEINQRIYTNEKSLFGSKTGAVIEIFKTWWSLRRVHADKIFILHGDARYKALVPPWLMGKDISQVRSRTRRHHTFDYARLAFPDLEDRELAFAPYILPTREKAREVKTVCLFPGGVKNAMRDDPLRRWPLEHYVELTQQLLTSGWKVSIGGGPSDEWIRPSFEPLMNQLNWQVGKLKIPQTVEFLSSVQLAVSHDTGPIHFASLADCPIITLFGPTLAGTVAPLKYLDMAIEREPKLPCQPCYDGRDYGKCTNNICLASISPTQVFERINQQS